MKNCRTTSGLQAAISRGERAQLKVYTTSTANQVLPGTWAVNGDSVTLPISAAGLLRYLAGSTSSSRTT